jgi:hypothetical protein
MTLTERLRLRSRRGPAADTTSPVSSPGEGALPIAGYDDLHEKQVIAQFRELSQVELAEIEAYERAHRNRRPVLDKLRYMRSPEPLPGYDAMKPTEVVQLIEAADTARIRAIRDYEGKFRRRHQVMSAAAQALPKAAANPDETSRRDEKALRTRTGIQERSDRNAG